MKSFYILLLALAMAAVSCRAKDGEPGPAGENTLTQQGFVSGTVTFVDDSNNTIAAPFKYEYYESLSDNRFYIYDQGADSDYEIRISRRDANDDYKYVNFAIAGYNNMIDGTEEDPFYIEDDFYFVTVSNGTLYEFNSYNTDITNINLDVATGRLTFDFTGNINSPNGAATVTGKVDVILYRVYHSMISWG